ncbi:MAG TPA: peptidoglycan DD-metalloendopeptidase family protein [Burkholderiales bacterium]
MADAAPVRVLARFLCAAIACAVALPAPLPAREREAQLEKLRARIERLQRELNETADRRDSTREELHALERRIGTTLEALRAIEAAQSAKAAALRALEQRERREREAQRAHLAAIEVQARTAFALGRQPHLKLLLNQEDPAAAARVLVYYGYFNEARLARLAEAEASLARLRALETEIRDQTRELEALRTRQERERHALEAARVRRAQLLAALNRQLSAQQDEIERLRADERRLQRLLQELRTVLPEAELPSPGPQERFGALKGRLPLPLAGRIAAGYGEPKGIGDLTWRGIFIAAREGDPVRAVARGRVAFADWLRGFGLLLILDHGDGYMTLYGHNQVLHRRTGDWVEAGETIAAAGNTGGAPAMGVYFEIRQNGVPHDPLQWCAAERAVPARARRE